MDTGDIIPVLASTIRLSVPLLLACLAGLYSERAGVFDIGLEGKMLGAAFGAATVAFLTGSAWIGLLAGMGVSLALAMVHGAASITLRGNQIISGVAINFLAAGLTTLLGQNWFRQGGRTPQLSGEARFEAIVLPCATPPRGLRIAPEDLHPCVEIVNSIPVLGNIYSGLLSGHPALTYLAFLAVPVTAWVLFRTRFGLRLRAVGENPRAVDTAGIAVNWMRYKALVVTGLLCGAAGAYLSTAQSAGFGADMTAGQGFIALAALIFAKWRPWPAMFTCLLFGFLNALQIRLQGARVPGLGWEVPVQAIQALPYILTVVLLAGFIGKAVGPKAGGVPYVKER